MSSSSIDVASLIGGNTATTPPPGADLSPSTSGTEDGDVAGSKKDIANIVASHFNDFATGLGVSSSALSQAIMAGKAAGLATAQQQQGIQAGAAAQVQINTSEEAAKLRQQQDDLEARASLGLTPGGGNDVISALNSHLTSEARDIMQREDALQQKVNTSFFDNPVSWFVNQFTIPHDRAALNTETASFKTQNEMFTDLQQRTGQQYQLNAATDVAVGASHLAAVNALTQAKATQDTGESNYKLSVALQNNASVVNAITEGQARLALDAKNTQINQDRLNLEVQREPLYEANKQETIARTQLIIAEKTNNDEGNAILQSKLDRMTATYGFDRIPVNEYRTYPESRKNALLDLMADPNIQNGVMAPSPVEALNRANMLNAPLTSGANLGPRKWIQDKMAQIENDTSYQNMKPASQIAAANNTIEQFASTEAKNNPASGGLYSLLPMSSVLKVPSIASMEVAKVLAPLAQDQNTPVDPQLLLTTASQLVRDGKMSVAQIADQYASLYQKAYAATSDIKQYRKFALPELSEQTGYNVAVYTGTGWTNGPKSIDAFNKAQWENVITHRVARDKIGVDMSVSSIFSAISHGGTTP